VVTYEGRYHTIDLSPDGRRFVADEGVAGNECIWGHDLDRGARFLFETGIGLHVPRFTPSGREVAFAANNGDIFIKSADGTGIARSILKKEPPQYPLSFSPDGRLLAITETSPVTGKDIWVVPLDGEPQPFIVTSAQENAAAFSPNGHWIAYQSNESGRPEIYVQPFPGPGQRVLISTGGGKEPIWSSDGEELFYRQGTAVVAVAIETTPTYDVSPDGTRFLMIENESAERMKLQVVLNFAEELAARVPR